MAERRSYRLIDLFAGCGGMTRGFLDSGRFDPVFAVEFDADAAATYAANFGDARRCTRVPIEDVETLPAGGRRHRRPALPGLLAAQPRRRRLRAARRSGASTCAHSSRAAPHAFVMENVPELLRSAEYAEFKKRGREARLRASTGRSSTPPTTACRSGAAARSSSASATADVRLARRRPTADPDEPSRSAASRGGRSATRSRGCRCKPNGEDWHIGRNPRPESIVRYQAVPHDGGNRFQMQRNLDRAGLGDLVPRCWRNKPTGHDRRLRAALVGPTGVHDPDGVLQAREGPLPAPERAPADHDPRGGPLHELPRRLRASRSTRR